MPKLTDQFIRSLQVPEGKLEVQEFDDELPGFGVRKFASCKASLFVKYSVGSQQRRKTLGPWLAGTLPTIRKEAAVVLAQARLGKDVVGEARKAQQEAAKAKKLGELVAPISSCARWATNSGSPCGRSPTWRRRDIFSGPGSLYTISR
jgi:hypothetical protein